MAIFDKPLFIFEMANNHQGSTEHGKDIIHAMSKVSEKYADKFDFAFKFQYRDLDTFIHPEYRDRMDIKNIKRFSETRLSQEEFVELMCEVKSCGMFAICTAFDEISADRIAGQGYDAIKIASCSFTDWPLLERIARYKLPVIASAAGSPIEDVDRVVSFFKHRSIPLTLMHCIAEYPTETSHQQMNQIDFYKERYPDLRIGFSTHEPPVDLNPIRIAIAKGVSVFEKHVGLPKEDSSPDDLKSNPDSGDKKSNGVGRVVLNAYSANPEEADAWLSAAAETYAACGVSGRRYIPNKKEMDDLSALKRGVFAKRDIKPGEQLDLDDIFFAFPCSPGQMVAGKMSKYASVTIKNKQVQKNAPIMMDDVSIIDRTGRIQEILGKVVGLIQTSSAVVPRGSTFSISHHYGIDSFEKTGIVLIDCINREYCKKLLVLMPGQAHPFHYHKHKEETFLILYGEMDVMCDDKLRHVKKGDTVVVERGVNHAFKSDTGCVFEEISTTHYVDDSYYEDEESFTSPRKTLVYLTDEMMHTLGIG